MFASAESYFRSMCVYCTINSKYGKNKIEKKQMSIVAIVYKYVRRWGELQTHENLNSE